MKTYSPFCDDLSLIKILNSFGPRKTFSAQFLPDYRTIGSYDCFLVLKIGHTESFKTDQFVL